LGDLITRRDADGFTTHDREGLVEIVYTFFPYGVGEVRVDLSNREASLSVTHHRRFHREVVKLLDRLQAAKGRRRSPIGPIERALSQKLSVDFVKTPFSETLRKLAEQTGVNIALDHDMLADLGLDANERVTLRVKDCSLRSVLELLTDQIDNGLLLVIWDESVFVTGDNKESRRICMQQKVYPVGHIVAVRGPDGKPTQDFETLRKMITCSVAPTTWEDIGGCGMISSVPVGGLDAMIVVQSESVHREISDMLAAMEKLLQDGRDGRLAPCYDLPPKTPAREAIDKALKQRVTQLFIEEELSDVAEQLGRMCGVSIVLDRRALEDVGVSTDMPVTEDIKNLPLRDALVRILRMLDLTYVVEDEHVLVTTPEESEMRLPIRLYPIGDLVEKQGGANEPDDEEYLADLITSIIRPTTWDHVGGPGNLAWMRIGEVPIFGIAQTEEVHAEVLGLLTALRRISQETAAGKWEPVYFPYEPTPEETAFQKLLEQQLARKIPLDFRNTTLIAAIEQSSDTTGIRMEFDKRALDDVGVGTDAPVSLQVRDVPFEEALDRVLKQHNLTWFPCSGLILVTTPEEAECRLETRLYPVPDLVKPPDESATGSCEPGTPVSEFDALIKKIESTVAPTTWDGVGGPGAVAGMSFGRAPVLVVSQTYDVQRRVARFLEPLRAEARKNPGAAGPPDGDSR